MQSQYEFELDGDDYYLNIENEFPVKQKMFSSVLCLLECAH